MKNNKSELYENENTPIERFEMMGRGREKTRRGKIIVIMMKIIIFL